MQIKKFLSGIKYKLERKGYKLVSTSLCGVPLKTTFGTVRSEVDQDDTWFFYLAKHSSVIYDIGCNVGYTALLALIQDPEKPYLLVDPNPKALNEAQLNLVGNNLGFKSFYYSGFVSNEENSSIKFYTIGSGAAGSMHASHAKSASSVQSTIEVKTITLDYLYSFYGLKPDLVKIDVEGAETLVMDGALKLVKATQCAFFIEMHNVEGLGMEQAGQFMIDWCKKVNYKVWYLKTGAELKESSTIKNRGKCHLLLMPKSSPYPNYLRSIKQSAPLPNTLE